MISLRERAQHKAGIEQEQKAVRRWTLLYAIRHIWPDMDILQWRRYSSQLAEMQQQAEEQRIAALAETNTTELPAIPKPYLSTRELLFGESVAQAATEEERERHTDPIHESAAANATRKLHASHFIETEQRAVVKVEHE